jgi:hypothetical protein
VGRVLAKHPAIGFELAGDLLAGFAGLDGSAPNVAGGRKVAGSNPVAPIHQESLICWDFPLA